MLARLFFHDSHMPLSREFQTVGAETQNAHFSDLDLSERYDKACMVALLAVCHAIVSPVKVACDNLINKRALTLLVWSSGL